MADDIANTVDDRQCVVTITEGGYFRSDRHVVRCTCGFNCATRNGRKHAEAIARHHETEKEARRG